MIYIGGNKIVMKEREKWADILKGFGAILVVIGHLVFYESNAKVYIYSFHMPLFFFISGYLYKSEKNFFKYLRKKTKSLLCPYFFFAFVSIIICYLLDGITMSKKDIILNFFFVNGSFYFNSSLWFLVIMFFTIITFNLLKEKLNINNNLKIISFISILLILCFILNDYKMKLYFGLEIVPHALLLFSIGYLIKINKKKIKNIINSVIKNNYFFIFQLLVMLSLAYILSIYNNRVNMSTSIYNNYFIYLVVAFLNIYAYVLLSKKIDSMRNSYIEKFKYVIMQFSSLSLIMFCTQRLLFKFYYLIQSKLGIDLLGGTNILVTSFAILVTLVFYYLYGSFRRKIYEKV